MYSFLKKKKVVHIKYKLYYYSYDHKNFLVFLK